MPDINLNEINWLAVVVAALAAFCVGGLWYGPLFSKPWIKAQGWSESKVAEIKANMSPPKFFGGMLASYLLLAGVLAVLAQWVKIADSAGGMVLAVGVWKCIAAVTLTHQLASGRRFSAFLIDASCELVYMLIIGAIIGGWR